MATTISPPLPPILIVEENPDDFYLLSTRIKGAGVRNPLVCHFDGDEAINYLKRVAALSEKVPVAVFTDIKIFGTDGLGVAAFVRSHDALRTTKVFVVSNSVDPKHSARAASIGVDGFLAKFPTTQEIFRCLKGSRATMTLVS